MGSYSPLDYGSYSWIHRGCLKLLNILEPWTTWGLGSLPQPPELRNLCITFHFPKTVMLYILHTVLIYITYYVYVCSNICIICCIIHVQTCVVQGSAVVAGPTVDIYFQTEDHRLKAWEESTLSCPVLRWKPLNTHTWTDTETLLSSQGCLRIEWFMCKSRF